MDIEESKIRIREAQGLISDAYAAVAPDKLKARRAELTEKQNDPALYSDPKVAQAVNSEAKYIDDTLGKFDRLFRKADDLIAMADLLSVEADDELTEELFSETEALLDDAGKAQISALLTGEYDKSDAILSLHAGAGGTEAQDWVSMLFRMYKMYCEKSGYAVEVLDRLDGDEAGIKSVTFIARGINAYGYLKAEKGVHRLVRISPFDANARRHTSFASLEVMPEIKDDITVTINPDEIRVDTYRSSGAGGQHINKTDSAIRITHFPTGIVVTCQDQRSQTKNKERAMQVLATKLYDYYQGQKDEEYASLRKGQVGTGDRSERIRTYNFPQGRVTDHRIGYTLYSIDEFMNGDLDKMVEALRLADQTRRLEGDEDK